MLFWLLVTVAEEVDTIDALVQSPSARAAANMVSFLMRFPFLALKLKNFIIKKYDQLIFYILFKKVFPNRSYILDRSSQMNLSN